VDAAGGGGGGRVAGHRGRAVGSRTLSEWRKTMRRSRAPPIVRRWSCHRSPREGGGQQDAQRVEKDGAQVTLPPYRATGRAIGGRC
jgi:hypothetical protein